MYARSRRVPDIWPGFVDALAALLLVLVFVLLIFSAGQFFLTDALSGRDRALADLNAQVADLGRMLSLEEATTASLESQLAELNVSLASLQQDLSAQTTALSQSQASLQASEAELSSVTADLQSLLRLRDLLQSQLSQTTTQRDDAQTALAAQTEVNAQAQAELQLLNRQLAAVREQLTALNQALEVAQRDIALRDEAIDDLGQQLNVALADKVIELAAYRSDFFGRLKAALGQNNPDLKVVGDRFVLQSELLFAVGSDDLGQAGLQQLDRLANTLRDVANTIPQDLDWVLRIDGHTDRRPIATAEFPSNWELSTARSLAIVKYLVGRGIPPERLAATGFSSHHPIAPGADEASFAQNRRIELKLTAR